MDVNIFSRQMVSKKNEIKLETKIHEFTNCMALDGWALERAGGKSRDRKEKFPTHFST